MAVDIQNQKDPQHDLELHAGFQVQNTGAPSRSGPSVHVTGLLWGEPHQPRAFDCIRAAKSRILNLGDMKIDATEKYSDNFTKFKYNIKT